MSRTFQEIQPQKKISKYTIACLVIGIIVIFIIGFWASEVRGSLYYGAVENFPYLLIISALLAPSLILTALFIFATEENFDAHDTWCMQLIFCSGIAFATWFVPVDIRMLGVEFCLIVIMRAVIAFIGILYIIVTTIWTFKFWILGIVCISYIALMITACLTRSWVKYRKRRKDEYVITNSSNVTTLPHN